VFAIGPEAVAAGMPATLLGCPFILMPGGLPELVNKFLEAYWRGTWRYGDGDEETSSIEKLRRPSRRYRPMSGSVHEMAHRLVNVLQWCSDRRMHPDRASIDPLCLSDLDLDRYTNQMDAGLWSSDGKPLSKTTIGQRQLAAIGLRHWANSNGYAEKADFARTTGAVTVPFWSGGEAVAARNGYLVVRRPDPTTILFPGSEKVRDALSTITDVGLRIAAELIFFCGLRASEVCGLQREDVQNVARASGGQRYISVLGKGRKRRNVEIDDELIEAIEDYIDSERSIRLYAHRKKSSTLLISEKSGNAYTYRTLWRCFRDSHTGISPHLGRHWYSVNYLLRASQREKRRMSDPEAWVPVEMMQAFISTDLIRLQQNLGYASLKTTTRYLVALSQVFDKASIGLAYQDMISGN